MFALFSMFVMFSYINFGESNPHSILDPEKFTLIDDKLELLRLQNWRLNVALQLTNTHPTATARTLRKARWLQENTLECNKLVVDFIILEGDATLLGKTLQNRMGARQNTKPRNPTKKH